jgi:glycosyltransferase involved in cell wall biosynthesis
VLRAALESLLAQTVEDMEILVIDDGSTQDPVHSVPVDPRIVIDRRPVNRGYAAVTNHAIRRARGTWITFVDADDVVAPTYVEAMLEAGIRHDADLVLMPLNAVRGGKVLGALPFAVTGDAIGAKEAFRLAVRGQLVLSQHVLLRRPEPDATEGFAYSDFVFLLRHLARSTTVALVHEPLYSYVIHDGSATGSLRPSVWELRRMPDLAAPAIDRLFAEAEAVKVRRELAQYVVTQMLHKAAREPRDTRLRRAVYRWCRARVGPLGILAALRRRDLTTAGSWTLLLAGRSVHGRAYRAYDRRKDAVAARG